MNARQRGACWLFLILLLGRGLDALDLPFERAAESSPDTSLVAPDSNAVAAGTGGPRAQTLKSPAGPALETAESASAAARPVHLNSAGERELQALPGVGPVLAARIVAYRSEHGDFRDVAQLRQVKGIGARLADRLAPLLRFD